MNGTQSAKHGRPVPPGPTPPAPAAAPPVPPTANSNTNSPNMAAAKQPNGAAVNGSHAPPPAQKGKKKAAEPQPVDPSQMYETLKNRIAALEEEEVHEEEEERRFGECLASSYMFDTMRGGCVWIYTDMRLGCVRGT